MNAFFVSSVAALVAASAASAGFTGFTADRVVLSNGNIQYKVYANFDNVGLPSGQSWVMLNAYSHAAVSGTIAARSAEKEFARIRWSRLNLPHGTNGQ